MSIITKRFFATAFVYLSFLCFTANASDDDQPKSDLSEYSATICCFGLKEFNQTQTIADELNKLKSKINEIDISNIQSVTVVGHTDTSGIEGYDNTALSIARANSVGLFLQDIGIPNRLIHLSGRGKTEPLLLNNEFGTPCSQPMVRCAKNRRAEVSIKHIVVAQIPPQQTESVETEQVIQQESQSAEVENNSIQQTQNYPSYSPTVATIFLLLMIFAFMVLATLTYSFGLRVAGGVFKNGLRWGGIISSALGVFAVIESGTFIPSFNILSPSLYSIIEIYRAAFSPLMGILSVPLSFNLTQGTIDIISLNLLVIFAMVFRGNISTLSFGLTTVILLLLGFFSIIIMDLFFNYSDEYLGQLTEKICIAVLMMLLSLTLVGPLGGELGFGYAFENWTGRQPGSTPFSDINTSKAVAILLVEVFVAMLAIGGLGNILDLIARLL